MKHFYAQAVMPGVVRINTLNGLGNEEIRHSVVIRDLTADEVMAFMIELSGAMVSALRMDREEGS